MDTKNRRHLLFLFLFTLTFLIGLLCVSTDFKDFTPKDDYYCGH